MSVLFITVIGFVFYITLDEVSKFVPHRHARSFDSDSKVVKSRRTTPTSRDQLCVTVSCPILPVRSLQPHPWYFAFRGDTTILYCVKEIKRQPHNWLALHML